MSPAQPARRVGLCCSAPTTKGSRLHQDVCIEHASTSVVTEVLAPGMLSFTVPYLPLSRSTQGFVPDGAAGDCNAIINGQRNRRPNYKGGVDMRGACITGGSSCYNSHSMPCCHPWLHHHRRDGIFERCSRKPTQAGLAGEAGRSQLCSTFSDMSQMSPLTHLLQHCGPWLQHYLSA